MMHYKLTVIFVCLLSISCMASPIPGGEGGHHKHVLIHVPYHIHTIHHYHKVPVYIKTQHHHYHEKPSHHGWESD